MNDDDGQQRITHDGQQSTTHDGQQRTTDAKWWDYRLYSMKIDRGHANWNVNCETDKLTRDCAGLIFETIIWTSPLGSCVLTAFL